MDSELPSNFDLIVIGTGMIESIVSAAASRVGKTVLHVDRDDYYGGHWASFNLSAIESFSKEQLTENPNIDDSMIGNDFFNIKDFKMKWNTQDQAADNNYELKKEAFNEESKGDETKESSCTLEKKLQEKTTPYFTKEMLLKESRKFNIDLAPKLQYARGDFVELLISSNIARYSEYRSVSRVLTWLNGQVEVVPCSRSDVFANNKVSLIEKRMLMKLLTSLEPDREHLQDYENKTFSTYLKDKKLTQNLIHYVLYSISQSTDSTPCLQGIDNTKRFLDSLGRFGKTPFLFSMYGSGETTQAFCRLSAVFGGIFALSQPLKHLILEDNKATALFTGDQHIKAEHFVLSIQKAPTQFVKTVQTKEYISRAVFITDRSIIPSEQEHLTLLMYPPENGKNLTTIIEMGSLTGTCPKNLFLVHFVAKQDTNPQDDFKHIIENLFVNEFKEENLTSIGKPQILWSCFFSLPDTSNLNINDHKWKNVYLCQGPDLDLDYDLAIKKAKTIFHEIYPDSEFLPRAPDPEEIIFGDESDTNDGTVSLTNNKQDEENIDLSPNPQEDNEEIPQ